MSLGRSVSVRWLFAGGLLAVAIAFFAFRDRLPSWLGGPVAADVDPEAGHHHTHGGLQKVKLTSQAQANLKLVSKSLETQTYWRTLAVPGTIIERPGQTDQGVSAPSAGVVAKVYIVPGDIVQPGQLLFTLRLVGDAITSTQSELFKTSQETAIAKAQFNRLEPLAKDGVLPRSRLTEVENQLQRLKQAADAYRQDLRNRGLTTAQIDGIADGKFVTEIQVEAPPVKAAHPSRSAVRPAKLETPSDGQSPAYEIQELNAELGQQVQAGQPLCLLGQHETLDIEGRAFRDEAALVENAAKQALPVEVEFLDDDAAQWPPLEQSLVVRSVASTIDPNQRTLNFYLSINNQSKVFEKDGQQRLAWRFRPGQRVRLHLRVERIDNVFVLPADAVVREGPEAYVFRQNGDYFERLPVHIVQEDRRQIVLAANDGSLSPGLFIAQSAAAQLNRAVKAQAGTGHAGVHMHADGSIHAPGQ